VLLTKAEEKRQPRKKRPKTKKNVTPTDEEITGFIASTSLASLTEGLGSWLGQKAIEICAVQGDPRCDTPITVPINIKGLSSSLGEPYPQDDFQMARVEDFWHWPWALARLSSSSRFLSIC
jgi:hypothetical protein